jgi:hypothetical protein
LPVLPSWIAAHPGIIQFAAASRILAASNNSTSSNSSKNVKTGSRDRFVWLPHKNSHGVWVAAANTTAVDLTKLTLTDLPSPEDYLEALIQSPSTTPKLPLDKIINNTLAGLSGEQVPDSLEDWLHLARTGVDFLSTNLPDFVTPITKMAGNPDFNQFTDLTSGE